MINRGIALGAGLYESRIVFPQWLGHSPGSAARWNAEAARAADTGRTFWVFVTTGPLTLLTLANLVVGWRSQGALWAWWLGSALAA